MSRHYDNRGRDQFNFENVQGDIVVLDFEPLTRPRFEWLILQQVEREVKSRLKQSLHNKVLIVLDKQEQPEQVKRLWDAEVKIGSKPSELLLPQTSILEVFEQSEIAGQLLILGTPGAGKTTTMLDLAQSLIEKAIPDSSYPIPVLFNLSSWKDTRLSISTWLVEELKLKYGVRKDIGKNLIEEKQLLPMLDGLDEVKPEHQESCVDSINQWLQGEERPLFVVVCSRREEYANYKTPLQLNGAIMLQELTDEQIRQYLSEVKRVELWQLLQQDTVLLKLVKTPLLLSIIVLSYEELSLRKWQHLNSTKHRIKMLLDAYVQRMLNREVESKAYRKFISLKEDTIYKLIFLARQLQQESQTEFLIERIQPSWLVTGTQKKVYRWNVSLIYGIISGPIFGLFSGQIDGLLLGLILGLIFGLIELINKHEQEINPVETFGWSWSFKEAKKCSISGLLLGLIDGLLLGLIFGLISGQIFSKLDELISGLISGLIGVLTFGLIYGLIFGLTGGLIGSEVDIKKKPNQGIWMSANNAIVIILISWLLSGLIGGLIIVISGQWPLSVLLIRLATGPFLGLISGLSSAAGKATIRHFALRLTLHQSGFIPWNYARFLNYCTDRCFLQRVGGRYRFIHKELQDYFAEM